MSLKFRKIDLHVHTPASHDFIDKNITADQVINKAISIGLDAIAVTDHNSFEWIDIIKEAASQKGFIIFPGIEISCGATQRGCVHVIGVFDIDRTKDDLQEVKGALDIEGEKENAFTHKSLMDVVNIIRGKGGLPVLAHANSTHGALNDIRGNPRIGFVKNKNLLAAEATNGDFQKEVGSRLIDYLNGSDVNYQRKLAVYKASGNRYPNNSGHCIDTIGESFSFFNMGELRLESLRQCFEDPDTRIFQDNEYDKINQEHPKILSIEIEGGFLDQLKTQLHAGMNSIIGGTGTGKSLLIEFLRFVFDKKPNQFSFKDHKSKLEKRLKANGLIKVIFQDEEGEKYELLRKYDSGRDPYNSEIKCQNVTTGNEFGGDINSIFPILVYSQNEIIKVAEDTNAQLELLDNFRDFKGYGSKIQEKELKLKKLDQELGRVLEEPANLKDLNKGWITLDEKIKKLEKKIKSKISPTIFDSYKKLIKERNDANNLISRYEEALDDVNEIISYFNDQISTDEIKNDSLSADVKIDIQHTYSKAVEALSALRKGIEANKTKSIEKIKTFEKEDEFLRISTQYEGALKQQEQEKEVETKRNQLNEEQQEIEKKISRSNQAVAKLSQLKKSRNGLLKELIDIRSQYSEERHKQAELITEGSENKLRVVIKPEDNKEKYLNNLSVLKIGSFAEEKEIESILDNLSPIKLVDIVIDADVGKLESKINVTHTKAENIIRELTKSNNLLKTLALQYESYPDDSIEISYQKKDGNYYPLAELSVGQKADALIMIALGDSKMPVIIDQPEDALDIPSIWTDICEKLRTNKHSRQFIFTTHNSSIAVSSDSDQYIVMEAEANNGWISKTGSIDGNTIKGKVIDHLEGGKRSYDLKHRKYNIKT